MKNFILIVLSFLIVSPLFSQENISGAIEHDGIDRTYLLYIPDSYEAGNPLVFNFHGYTSSAIEQMFYGDFRSIADSAGFIIACPQGTLDNTGTSHWNVGWGTSSVDDVGFTSALIDSLHTEYGFSLDRVYSTGMSNGGFMSYVLACELSERIAAIASVTGTMNLGSFSTCNAEHPMPVMEIHGTLDTTVPYNGAFWIEGSEDVVDYWANFNNSALPPAISMVPDIDAFDGCTAEHWVYENGDDGAEVELYKVIGGAHTWPGAAITIGVTNQDFDASTEIWRFFSQYDVNGAILPNGLNQSVSTDEQLNLSPNPTDTYLNVAWEGETTRFQILDFSGRTVYDSRLFKGQQQLTLDDIAPGEYLFYVQGSSKRFTVVR